MRFRLYPNIYIHSWGGLGSQLFALMLMMEVKRKFKYRQVKLIVHESGVTLRKSEITNFLPSNEIFEIHDFDTDRKFLLLTKISRVLNLMKKFMKFIFIKVRILAFCNSEEDFKIIKPWILQIRGHYTNRKINEDCLHEIISLLWPEWKEGSEPKINNLIALHFRLGDLLELETKKPLEESRVVEGIDRLSQILSLTEITVFSDSALIASNKLKKVGCKLQIRINQLEIFPAMKMLVYSKAFIATPSKISEWVIILRIFLGVEGQILIPVEMCGHLIQIYPAIFQSQWVHVY